MVKWLPLSFFSKKMEAEYLVGDDGEGYPERPCTSGIIDVASTVLDILSSSEPRSVSDVEVRQMAVKMMLGEDRWSSATPSCSTLSCLMERDRASCISLARYAAAYAIRAVLNRHPAALLSQHLLYVALYVEEVIADEKNC